MSREKIPLNLKIYLKSFKIFAAGKRQQNVCREVVNWFIKKKVAADRQQRILKSKFKKSKTEKLYVFIAKNACNDRVLINVSLPSVLERNAMLKINSFTLSRWQFSWINQNASNESHNAMSIHNSH